MCIKLKGEQEFTQVFALAPDYYYFTISVSIIRLFQQVADLSVVLLIITKIFLYLEQFIFLPAVYTKSYRNSIENHIL